MPISNVTLAGIDVTLALPGGVRSPEFGEIVAGDPNYAVEFGGVLYLFRSAANAAQFKMAGGAQYTFAVGNHCTGAMAQDRLVPANPNNHAYVRFSEGGGMWMAFGSSDGARRAREGTEQERQLLYSAALANFRKRFG
jgi:hypothetical protein